MKTLMKTLKMNLKILVVLSFHIGKFIILNQQLHAQCCEKPKSQLGIGGFYNFQTESNALEIRYKKFITKQLAVTPRLSYYSPGNKIHELYTGADLNYHLNTRRKLQPYIFAGGYYNNWINYEESGAALNKKNNLAAEMGLGIVYNKGCRLKPYAEWRYDTHWKEGSVGAGLFLSFSKCPRKKGYHKCPSFK